MGAKAVVQFCSASRSVFQPMWNRGKIVQFRPKTYPSRTCVMASLLDFNQGLHVQCALQVAPPEFLRHSTG